MAVDHPDGGRRALVTDGPAGTASAEGYDGVGRHWSQCLTYHASGRAAPPGDKLTAQPARPVEGGVRPH